MLIALLLAASAMDDISVAALLKGVPRQILLPAGIITVRSPIRVPRGFSLRGHAGGTTLRAAQHFKGKAILICESDVDLSHLSIDGNRAAMAQSSEIPPADRSFIVFYDRNGIVANKAQDIRLHDIKLTNILNFPVIISASKGITIERVHISNSGSLRGNGRNNTSGGILLEEGTSNFTIKGCKFRNVRGNGVWTHSLYTSRRNGPGLIDTNDFETIARDAIQVGHATSVMVRGNSGRRIGWPVVEVDVEGGGTPVAIDTAGNVDQTTYTRNHFEEINGKCIDLDGFHDGVVSDNTCINRGRAEDYPLGHYGIVFNNTNPDMHSTGITVTGNLIDGTKFGGIFVIGTRHKIRLNRLLNLNLAGCNENAAKFGCLFDANQPDLLRVGIYLAAKAERADPARDNVIVDNVISGHAMKKRCLAAAPLIDLRQQTIERNDCTNSNPR
ncbi:MAG: right-handed parallel beta-helix repeat-containing protein [Bryobacteraceae bacterium]|nr:right-handed parallel beta-helix repeat-containing protein [Bryobacteraceae bacterium]